MARVSVPKRWLTPHADSELHEEHITTCTTNIEWTYITYFTYPIHPNVGHKAT